MKFRDYVRTLDPDEQVMVSDVSCREGITVACKAHRLPIRTLGNLEVVSEERKDNYLKVEIM